MSRSHEMRRAALLVSLLVPFAHIHARTQAAMNAEARADFAKADAELNKTYGALLTKLPDAESKEKLKLSQRAWLAFRDAEAAFAADQARGGSMAPILRYETMTDLTLKRIKELEAMVTEGAAAEEKHATPPSAMPTANSSSADSAAAAPAGLAFDDNGNLLVADSRNGTILKFTPEGAQNTFASGLRYPGLRYPLGLIFDTKGNLWVANASDASNSFNGTILKFTPDGTRSTFASKLTTPSDLAVDKAGNLFVSDSASNLIFKFAPDGTKTSFASGLSWPKGLAFDAAGNLFVADAHTGTIFKFAPNGAKTSFASGLQLPCGLAFDAAGNLFVADNDMGTILKINSKGTRTTFASWLNDPTGLAFDKAGNLFVSGGDSILKFTPNGTRSTFFGGSADNTAYATADGTSISPNKEWEYRSYSTEGQAKIVNPTTNQVVLDLSEQSPGGVLWAPDSKRFAFNHGQGRAHQTALYQLRNEHWVALESPEDKALKRANVLVAAHVKRKNLSKKTYPRTLWWTVEADQWVDASTLVVHASVAKRLEWGEDQAEDFGGDFLFTLKFDDAGNWKIVNTHQMSEKEVEEHQ
jgi:uncharacterized protein YecT (DUF1311 family)/sugar lactone lactonase YvrE